MLHFGTKRQKQIRRVKQYDAKKESEEDYMSLAKDGRKDVRPFFIEASLTGEDFKTVIDTDSTMTFFRIIEMKQIMRERTSKCDR